MDYLRLTVLEPDVLGIIGQEPKQKGTDRLGGKQNLGQRARFL
jgi:hypothetical protein